MKVEIQLMEFNAGIIPNWVGHYAVEVLAGGTLALFSVWLGFICRYMRKIRDDISSLQQELIRLRNDVRRDFNGHLIESEKRFSTLEAYFSKKDG